MSVSARPIPSLEVEAYLTALRIHEAEVHTREDAERAEADQAIQHRIQQIRSRANLARVLSLAGMLALGVLIAMDDQEAAIGFALIGVPFWLGVCVAISMGRRAAEAALEPGGKGALVVANMVGLSALMRR